MGAVWSARYTRSRGSLFRIGGIAVNERTCIHIKSSEGECMTSPTRNRVLQAMVQSGRLALLTLALTGAGLVATACDVHSPSDAGALASITVTPNVTMAVTSTQQFTAVGADADNVPVAITPVWSVVAGGGTISPTGLFTAGNTPGVYNATVQATSD